MGARPHAGLRRLHALPLHDLAAELPRQRQGMDVLKSGLFTAVPYGVSAILGIALGSPQRPDAAAARTEPADRRNSSPAAPDLLGHPARAAGGFVWLILALISLSLACSAPPWR